MGILFLISMVHCSSLEEALQCPSCRSRQNHLPHGSAANTAKSRTRIFTGQDLYEACKMLSEFMLNPEGSTPQMGLCCRQYILGYFASLRIVQDGSDAQSFVGHPFMPLIASALMGRVSMDSLRARLFTAASGILN